LAPVVANASPASRVAAGARFPLDRGLALEPNSHADVAKAAVTGVEDGGVEAMPSTKSSGTDTKPSALNTPTDLSTNAAKAIAEELNAILADSFALYLKTKNFHWHMSGPHFRDYHLMLDEQSDQIFATTDPIAERVRKLGGRTIRSIGHIAKLTRIKNNDAEFVSPLDMLSELANDNRTVAAAMRKAHDVCDDHKDVATASLLEVYIDDTERRIWFLFEASRGADDSGH
jgi:starvation-inducible DNA-binding protein